MTHKYRRWKRYRHSYRVLHLLQLLYKKLALENGLYLLLIFSSQTQMPSDH